MKKQLLEKRGSLIEKMNALASKAETEGRNLTADEVAEVRNLENEISTLDGEIEAAEILERRKPAPAPAPKPAVYRAGEEADREKMRRAFSFAAMISGRADQGLVRELTAEAHREFREAGVGFNPNAVAVPAWIFKRDMTATGGSNGSEGGVNVATEVGGIIDALLPEMVLGKLGVTALDGLVGNVNLPVSTTTPTAAWETEVSSLNEQSPAWSKLALAPKRLGAYVEVSNQLMIQGGPAIEQFVRRWLLQGVAIELEKAAINGGGSNEPVGIIANSNVNAVYAGGATSNGTNANGANPVWADVVNLYSGVANSNGNGYAYLTSPQILSKLATTPRQSSGVEGQFIVGADRSNLFGFPLHATTNVPANLSKGSDSTLSAMIFGDFSKLVLASWGGMEILVDPYSASKTGQTTLVLNTFVDAGLTQPSAFAVCKDMNY